MGPEILGFQGPQKGPVALNVLSLFHDNQPHIYWNQTSTHADSDLKVAVNWPNFLSLMKCPSRKSPFESAKVTYGNELRLQSADRYEVWSKSSIRRLP